ncbi:MAG: hypothetical protein ACI4SG_00735 [Oligosphaeraceae bacterium]
MNLLATVPLLAPNELPGPGPYNAVARLLKYADTDTDLVSLGLNRNGGLRISVSPSATSGGGEAEYSGPFAAYRSGTSIKVNPGYFSLNGDLGDCPGAILAIPSGEKFICVHLALVSDARGNGSMEGPEIRFSTPSATDYPVALCSSGQIVNFRVPVASFIFAYPGGSV